jgi:hypothetical protein
LYEKASKADPRAGNELMQYVKDLKLSPTPVNTSAFEANSEVIENFKKENLAFAVIFQKSYMLSFMDFMTVSMGQLEEILPSGANIYPDVTEAESPQGDDDDDSYDDGDSSAQDVEITGAAIGGARLQKIIDLKEHVDVYLQVLNRFVSSNPQFLSVTYQFDDGEGARNFWQGSLLKAGGTIDFAQVAAKRAKELISSVVLIGLLKSTKSNPTKYVSFEDLWDDIISNDSSSPGLVKKLRYRVNAMVYTGSPTGLAERILAQFEIPFDEDKAKDEVRVRLQEIWKNF